MNLSTQKCVPCEVGGEPMKTDEIALYAKDVPTWKVSADEKSISKKFKFKDFKEALAFVNKVGAIAEEQGHHPDITFTYGEVTVTFWTHNFKGLSSNDFIMAAKVDRIS